MNADSIDIGFARRILEFLIVYNLFGEHLALSIELSTMTASKLAQAIGVTPAAISQWCSGKRLPDSGAVYRITKRLNMPEEQQQSLMTAWQSTRFFHGYIDYLEEAIAEEDLETVREILEKTIQEDPPHGLWKEG